MLGGRGSALLADKKPPIVGPPSDWELVPGFELSTANWSTYRANTSGLLTYPAAETWQWESVASSQIVAFSKLNWTAGDFLAELTYRVVANTGGDNALFLSFYWGVIGDGTAGWPGDVSAWPGTTADPTVATWTISASNIADHARGYRIGFGQTGATPVATPELHKFNLTTAEPLITGFAPAEAWANVLGTDYLLTITRRGGTLTVAQKNMTTGEVRSSSLTDAGVTTWSDGRFGLRIGNTRTIRWSSMKVYKLKSSGPDPLDVIPAEIPTGLALQGRLIMTATSTGQIIDLAGKQYTSDPTQGNYNSSRINSCDNVTIRHLVYSDSDALLARAWTQRKFGMNAPVPGGETSDNSGFFFAGPLGTVTLEDSFIRAFDGVRCENSTNNVTFVCRRCYIYAMDDAIQNDNFDHFTAEDCLTESYVGYSSRPGKDDTAVRPINITYTDSLVALAMILDPDRLRDPSKPSDYNDWALPSPKDPNAKCHQLLWKLRSDLSDKGIFTGKFTNVTFFMPYPHKNTFTQELSAWCPGTYTNCLFIWGGPGDYRKDYNTAPLPPGVAYSNDVNLWLNKRRAWLRTHSFTKKAPPPLTYAQKQVQLALAVAPAYDHMSPGYEAPNYPCYTDPLAASCGGLYDRHIGQDVGCIPGTKTYCLVPGVVTGVYGNAATGVDGKHVVVRGDDGLYWIYGHTSDIVSVGQKLVEKQEFGAVAAKSPNLTSWSPHVHVTALKIPYPYTDPAIDALAGFGIVHGTTEAKAEALAAQISYDPVEAYHNWLNR